MTKILEVPVRYTRNLDEVEKGVENGITVEPDDVIQKTTFIIPDGELIRINPLSCNPEKTIVWFVSSSDSYEIDADYETVIQLFKMLK